MALAMTAARGVSPTVSKRPSHRINIIIHQMLYAPANIVIGYLAVSIHSNDDISVGVFNCQI
jgi:hypothetical protein